MTKIQTDCTMDQQPTRVCAHETEQNQTADNFYSTLNGKLLSLLVSKPQMQKFNICKEKQVKDFVNKYQCAFGSWPVIVDGQLIDQLREITSPLPSLCYRALELMFEGDAQAFADYFQLPASFYNNLTCNTVKREQLLMRYDYLYQQKEAKLLEINAGSNVGGWELDSLKVIIEGMFKQFPQTQNWRLSYRQVMIEFMQALVGMGQPIAKARQRNPNILLLAVFPDFSTKFQVESQLNLIYNMLQEQHLPKGTLSITESTNNIQVDENDAIYFGGKQMDIAFVNHPELPSELYEQLFKSHQSEQIVCPDTLAHRFVGNKLLFALLHEPKVLAQLSPQEQTLVQKHIPWSCKVKMDACIQENQGAVKVVSSLGESLTDYAKANKDILVLKKAESLKGDHVRVGKFITAQQWADDLEVAIAEGDWLLQSYCSPDHSTTCVYPQQPSAHHFIWGAFDFADNYGGSIVRAVPVEQESGVINAAKGAIVIPVVEDASRSPADMATLKR
ncbi:MULTISPECIES: hypothetical protein [unclassified Pseudoalteromonas]|uniref:hypothetical protein n=1 Tax=unclassified Pseudoalteromonas TaxID=194690 RepID=UPI000403FEF6|nr:MULTISPECIES: hypothetical protein [unclassified Pseudoalteromonas]PCC14212.1 hypothetical protein CIK86_13715 [Pseudoalteromonas sp. JB197]SJN16413.1 hypothetical protein CZ797_00435 [Pseudoalteromonas sp. JB197]